MSDVKNIKDDAERPYVRKPPWIRAKAPISPEHAETRQMMRDLNLNTVCEEAACPNIGECWEQKHATVMILGDTCTRACAFCNIKTGARGALPTRWSPNMWPPPAAPWGWSISSSPASTGTT